MREWVALLVGLLVLVMPRPGLAQSPAELAREATALYADGAYVEAAEHFERAIAGGLDHAHLHHNHGNALWRAGEAGRAIAAWRRALLADPSLGDTRANLEFARARIAEPERAPRPLPAPARLALAPAREIGPARAAWLALGLLWLAVLLAAAGHHAPRRRGRVLRLARVALALALLSAASLALLRWDGRRAGDAVVVAESLEVRSGPGEGYHVVFVIHEGLELAPTAGEGDWLQVDLGDGIVGWVERQGVEAL